MKERVIVKYKKFDENKEVFIPKYKSDGASGMDIMSIENYLLQPGTTVGISTNLSVEIPEGYEIQIRPRSGLALKNGITVLNTPGTIDSDYRGEIVIILFNASPRPFLISSGDRIAQMVLCKVEKMELYEDKLSETERGADGFGSTGVK